MASDRDSSRESSISGTVDHGTYLESARIVLDRSFESVGFRSVPFAVEAGDQRAIVLESEHASLLISFDAELVETPAVIEPFVPHFFLDDEVPGVQRPARYTLVCIGGTGRLRAAREGSEVRGDLAITVACRTYVDGRERDESEIHLAGAFRAAVE